jgi:hypothetical protein
MIRRVARARRHLALITASTALLAGCHDASGPSESPLPPAAADTARVTVHPDLPGVRIPADFLGLGFEMPALRDPRFAGDAAFERLLTNLGPGVLRFGGNSVELTGWAPVAPGQTSDALVLTPADFDRIFGFAARVGWHVIMDLRLARFEPDTAAAEVAALRSAGGSNLLAAEIGNEPDLYPASGARSAGWNGDSLAGETAVYATRIHARTPGAPVAAPATTCSSTGPSFFDAVLGAGVPLVLATHHFYPMTASAPADSPEFASIANMLSATLMARTAACINAAARTAAAHGVPLRLDETNSASGFGKAGVSDVLASALWAVDHFFTAAEQGTSGVNVQSGTDLQGGLTCAGIYLPFCGRQGGPYTARPLYYAMLLVHAAARGRLVPVAVQSTFNVTAHAALDDDGTLRVVVVNKEATHAVRVRLVTAGAYANAGVLRLVGPALDRGDSVTFAGATVGGDGSWTPGPAEAVGTDGTGFVLTVPAGSAGVVSLSR